jgi:hypothetical protein
MTRFRPRRISNINPAAAWAGGVVTADIRARWALAEAAAILDALAVDV